MKRPNYTLLCVDDPQTTSLVADYFGRAHPDIDVLQASSAREGFERLDENEIDCIVSGCQVTDSDGSVFFDAVRETTPDLPCILFTGEGEESVAADAIRAGAADCMRRVTGSDQCELLANRVRTVVDGRRNRAVYRELFNAVDDAAMILDIDAGEVVDANTVACEHWGIAQSDIAGLAIDDLQATVPAADGMGVAEWLRTRNQDESTVVDWRCELDGRDPFWVEARVRCVTIDDRERGLVITHDITDRRYRERATDALLSTARDLMTMTEREAVCETAVETVSELFDADASRAYLISHEIATDPLPTRPVAATDAARTAVPDDKIEAAFGVDDILDAEANSRQYGYRDGDEAPGTLSVELELPLGHHGLLYIGSTQRCAFNQYELNLARIFAAHVGAALDRADRDRLLREREQELTDKRDELAALNHVNEVIRDVNQALVHVSTRDDIERLVCERFAAADRYRYAWIGRYSAESNQLTSAARAGIGDGDGLTETISLGGDPDDEILAQAITDQEVTIIPEIARSSLPTKRIEHARSNGYKSVAYVPVTYQNILYDILIVYAETRDAFGSDERTILAELGETIGSAINSAQRRSTRYGTDVAELTFSVRDDRSVPVALSAAVKCEVEFISWSPQSSRPVHLFVRVQDATPAVVTSWAEDFPSVEEIVELDDSGDGTIFKIESTESPIVEYVAEQGVQLVAMHATNGRGTVVVRTYADTNLRQFTELFETEFAGTELLSRDVQHDQSSDDGPWSQIANRLTDRQYEVLQVAFHGGFFDNPRKKNGEDLAALLGITQPTFHQHLRVGQRELLASVFEYYRQV
ncbi:bacterio-opsin activator domain-containing protein [Natrinema amylolyticum]|uniref:bacterio-opsin activator domain-containing protein n=1 Tax=Natrinema amylolyticum TaxID=2878679 RepID=UPI001CFA42CD|nr:bacterio-opsin activator domain-containing protein [Natrinema amylolyticum]